MSWCRSPYLPSLAAGVGVVGSAAARRAFGWGCRAHRTVSLAPPPCWANPSMCLQVTPTCSLWMWLSVVVRVFFDLSLLFEMIA